MFRTLFNATIAYILLAGSLAHAGIVIESTRYLYKEGAREITSQIENKDDMPYLIKSWVETNLGSSPAFTATPPLFRLEAKQQNTVRIFSAGNINAPKDRESLFYFNVMAIPPSDEAQARNNTIQLAVRHRMRLIFRPKSLLSLTPNIEAKKLEWRKTGNKIILKNPTPFFFYFNTVKLGNMEIKKDIKTIPPFTTQEITVKQSNESKITWKIVNDYGGAGSLYSSSL
ncbi:molecular chaperone [Leclercia adecarboxylata]|uniref:fimbrial biogenesis chaperone n=1 Tax=Leclercia adecarboxylata TaxID=83655 RepID=UPI0011197A58|nr:molecular chaperone [Leclercia adecarboxylata]QCZ27589.1 molecular chaperone [Leclercia adecarboxylata]